MVVMECPCFVNQNVWRPRLRSLDQDISVLASTRGDLGEAKLSCKPDMKAPLYNNRFLKCEPQYPHELSCKKKKKKF